MLLPSFAGTFTEVWEATFKQAAPAPTDYSTINGAYRNGVEAVLGMDDLMSCSPSCDAKDQKYFPEQHGYPGIQKHRQTFGVAWGDYGARLCLLHLHAMIAAQILLTHARSLMLLAAGLSMRALARVLRWRRRR